MTGFVDVEAVLSHLHLWVMLRSAIFMDDLQVEKTVGEVIHIVGFSD